MLPLLLFVTQLGIAGTDNVGSDLAEYCQWESFNATCDSDEVVVMEQARYGRMAIGRCVSKNYGYVGCSIDVLSYMDTICSGRQICKFIVPDETLRDRRPCPKDFSSYIEASYRCKKVEQGAHHLCSTSRYINVTTTTGGYLASTVTSESGLGSDACPWIIRVDPGQRINVTLLDFSLSYPFGINTVIDGKANVKQRTYCHKYAVIKERDATRETVVCGGEKREKNVYVSATNTLEIHVMRYNSPKKSAYFVLQYEAIGCPVLQPPKEGWLDQEGSDMVMGCNKTKEKWYLRCDGRMWVGDVRSCTNGGSDESMWNALGDNWSSPLGILIVTALGVALGLVIGVIMLTSVLFCLKRRRDMCSAGHPVFARGAATESGDEGEDNYTPYCKNDHNSSLVPDQMELVNLGPDGNYGAMWKARPPSYSQTTAIDHDTAEPPQARTIHSNVVEVRTVDPRATNGINGVTTKITALSSFRPPDEEDLHVYESPKFVRREASMGDIREIAVQGRENS